MRVTGKTKKNDNKSLSIQYSLSGLSFCSPDDLKKYGPVAVEEISLLLHAVNGEGSIIADTIELIVNDDRFVVVPVEIYDPSYEKDYLYTKNIVCGDTDVIRSSVVGDVVVIFPVNGNLLTLLVKEASVVKVSHILNLCLIVAYRYAERTKKNILVVARIDGVFSYAVVGKKSLLAVDCTVDEDALKADVIMELLNNKYGLSKGVVISDDNNYLASAVKRIVGKVVTLSDSEYRDLLNENSQR